MNSLGEILVASCVVLATAVCAYRTGYSYGHDQGWFDCYSRMLRKMREKDYRLITDADVVRRPRRRPF